MTDQFDPYYKWLAISPDEQPPDYYRLLGLAKFETDADVIDNAADQRMAHVRNFQAGKHGQLSQKILNEISAARVCLLDPEKRAKYDAQLSANLAESQPFPSVDANPTPNPFPAQQQFAGQPASAHLQPDQPLISAEGKPAHLRYTKRPSWLLPVAAIGGSAALLLAIFGVIFSGLLSSDREVTDTDTRPQSVSPFDNGNDGGSKDISSDNRVTKFATSSASPSTFSPPTPVEIAKHGIRFKGRGYIAIPETKDLATLDKTFTAEMWCRWETGVKSVTLIGAFGRHQPTDGKPICHAGWNIQMLPSEKSSDQLRLKLSIADKPGRTGIRYVDIPRAPMSEWHHFAVCRTAKQLVIYINGKESAVTRVTGSIDANAVPARLGFGSDPQQLGSFDARGEIRAFRLSSTVQYNGPFTPPTNFKVENQTEVLLDFLKPLRQRIVDISGKSRNANAIGTRWVRPDGTEFAFGNSVPPISVGTVWNCRETSKGSFRKQSSGRWIHQSPSGTNTPFIEIQHNTQFVELAAIGNARRVRLAADAAQFWGYTDARWGANSPGGWAATSTSVASTTSNSGPGNVVSPTSPPATTPATTVAQKKLPKPSEEEIQSARDEVRKVMSDQIAAATNTPAKVKLFETLYKSAESPDEKPAIRFALIDDARLLATTAGQVEWALKSIDLCAKVFEVDAIELKYKALEELAKSVRARDQRDSLIAAALRITDSLVENSQIDMASVAVQIAVANSVRASAELRVAARKRRTTFEALKKLWDAAKAAEEQLKAKPNDPQANLLVGKKLCLIRREWEKGLPYLARGDDASFKSAAEKDIAAPDDAADQLVVADAWWDLAELQSGRFKDSVRLRSRHWYKLAEPNAPAFAKQQISERLELSQSLEVKSTPEIPLVSSSDAPSSTNKTSSTTESAHTRPIGNLDREGMIGRIIHGGQRIKTVARYNGGLLRQQLVFQKIAPPGASITTNNLVLELQGAVPVTKGTQATVTHFYGGGSSGSSELMVNGQLIGRLEGARQSVQHKVNLSKGNNEIHWNLRGSWSNCLVEITTADGKLLPIMHDQKMLSKIDAGTMSESWLGQRADPQALEQTLQRIWQLGGRVSLQGLKDNRLTYLSIDQSSPIPEHYWEFQNVTFSNTRSPQLDDSTMRVLNSAGNLSTLYVRNANITDVGLEHLSKLRFLTHLTLKECSGITGTGLRHLNTLQYLTALNLDGSKVSSESIQQLNIPSLYNLNISNTQIDDRALDVVANSPSLIQLYLNNNRRLTDAGYAKVSRAKRLSVLSLESANLSEVAIREIAQLPNLQSLYMTNARIDEAALVHLKNLNLSNVRMSSTNVTDRGLANLAAIRSISTLYLGGTKVTDAGLAHLKNWTSLQTIDLSSTEVTDDGLDYIIAGNSKLRRITLTNAKSITDAGIAKLHMLKRLEYAYLQGTSVTVDGVMSLKRAIPNLRVYGPGNSQ